MQDNEKKEFTTLTQNYHNVALDRKQPWLLVVLASDRDLTLAIINK